MSDPDREPTTASASTASPSDSSAETARKAGLDPEEFQRQLVFVTAMVLVLGLVGGTCLGMKIKRAENVGAAAAEQQEQMTPAERAREATTSAQE